mgnify:CR=1 FL=1
MPLQFSANINEIYNGAETGKESRWVAADWFDRILFVAPGAKPLFWSPGMDFAREIPGLVATQGYDGLEVFNGHLLIHYEDVIKWSAKNDYSLWIPINQSPSVASGTLLKDIVAEEISGEIGPVDLSNMSGTFTDGQFVRIVSNEFSPSNIVYDYFKVVDSAKPDDQNATTITTDQSVEAGETGLIFFERSNFYNDWTIGARLTVNDASTELTIKSKSKNKDFAFETKSGQETVLVPPVGTTVQVRLEGDSEGCKPGDYVSIEKASDTYGFDIYKVISDGNLLTLERTGFGSAGASTEGEYLLPDTRFVVHQDFVEVENKATTNVGIQRGSTVETTNSVKLETLGYTGSTRPGNRIPAGAIVETLPANESGEVTNAGSRINGDVYAITTLADQAYVLKEWSIQSMQDVGADQGTFFFRTEIHDEGLLSKYSWTRFGDRSIAFIGHKNFYVYTGGQDLQPVGSAQWDTFRKQLDRARRDEIVAHHNKAFSEIWFIYPTLNDETKVLIFNYEFQTITIDEYPTALNGLTGVGTIEWELAPTWQSLDISEEFNDADKKYYQYVDEGEQEYTILATGGDPGNANQYEDTTKNIPRLLVHGRVYSRNSRDDCNLDNSNNYECLAETPDFDWGEPESFKYLDTVYLALHVPKPLTGNQTLEVYAGARDNLDEAIRWTNPQTVSITGSGNGITRVNLVTSGRYIRLKFRSNTVDAKWQISAYRMIARMGATY